LAKAVRRAREEYRGACVQAAAEIGVRVFGGDEGQSHVNYLPRDSELIEILLMNWSPLKEAIPPSAASHGA
jgi:hypothetical protein